jgi:hypothetical protein
MVLEVLLEEKQVQKGKGGMGYGMMKEVIPC